MGSQLQRICDLIKYEMRWDTMPTATWHTPSSFKIGRHSQLWLSTLHLMHLWAQLHRQSLFWHMCKEKWKLLDESIILLANNSLASACTASISTYSYLLQSIHLQWGSSLVRVLTCHNYCGNQGHCDCQVALAFGCIQWPNNIDPCIGGHARHLLLHDKVTQISGSARLVQEVFCTFRHQLCIEHDITAALLPHQG